MSTSIILSVLSDDRPGIVESLSQTLSEHGGNWTESTMMSLSGKFAGILLASVPDASADAFLSALDSCREQGIQVTAQRAAAAGAVSEAREFTIDLVGQDRPGIVHDITRILAAQKASVRELDTHVQSASMSGEHLFLAHARVELAADASVDALRDQLEDLANELMVDIKIEH